MPTPKQITRFQADLAALGVRDGDRLAVAVSGGPDSLALLLLAAARGATVAATVNHGLRPDSVHEVAMVAEVCGRLDIPHETLNVSVDPRGQGIQAAARYARYEALCGWAGRVSAGALATAHHADDQAETFLMRAARGSGVAGLAGIRRRQEAWGGVPIIRPVLGWRRQALRLVVDRAGLVPVEDASNDDDRFDRTLMRRVLAREGDVLKPEGMAAAAAHLADVEEALLWTVAKEYAARVDELDDQRAWGFTLDPAGLPPELLRRLVRDVMQAVDEMERQHFPLIDPPGADLVRLVARVASGETSTLAGVKVTPGPLWRFEPAPPHRSG